MNSDEEQLYQKLIKNKVSITKEEYENAVKVYKHLLDFYLNQYIDFDSNRFSFFNTPKRNFGMEDRYYFKIFMKIIEMQKKNLLMYLDYVLLLDNSNMYSNMGFRREYAILKELYDFLECVCNHEDFLINYIEDDQYVIEGIRHRDLIFLLENDTVPEDYKTIIGLFDTIFNDYQKYNNYDSIGLDAFLNVAYYYFIMNNLFNDDPERVIAFLNDIKDNITLYIERINLSGIKNGRSMLMFVDYIFNTNNKVRIMK